MKLSIIVPAYNEEKSLAAAIQWISHLLKEKNFSDYELLIFNDCSKDATGAIADGLAKSDAHIRVFHNPTNLGFGFNYIKGVEEARGEYITLFPGDNENADPTLWNVIGAIGKADIVIGYTENTEARPLSRRFISWLYGKILNLGFGLHIRYYNGMSLYKRELVGKALPSTFGFAFAAAILIRLIKSGFTYLEVPIRIQANTETRKTSAFKIKNIISVFKTIISLWWDIMIKRERISNVRN
ncbi:MAG TPA: glycosyltransferase family 2 protein [Candidatus Paceibacterota bacterium]